MTRDELAGLPFRDLLKAMSMTQAELHRRWGIPLRTMGHWAAGDRDCPPYVRLMMAELAGIKTED